jgi:hypothetical protein
MVRQQIKRWRKLGAWVRGPGEAGESAQIHREAKELICVRRNSINRNVLFHLYPLQCGTRRGGAGRNPQRTIIGCSKTFQDAI